MPRRGRRGNQHTRRRNSDREEESEDLMQIDIPEREEDHEGEEEEEDQHNLEDEDSDMAGRDPLMLMMRHLANRAGITINPRSTSTGSNALSGRFQSLLEGVKSNDPSVQYMSVQELNEVLSMSTEESIGPGSGSGFSVELFLPALVNVISGESNALGVDNPELQLLGCRCVANLLEALPLPITKHVIRHGSNLIPVLCMKLTNVEFIDVVEQAISLLQKLSVDYPREICASGGLSSVLMFLDFFPTSVQRMAVQCASNLLKDLPQDYFGVCLDVMQTLVQLLMRSDQRLVEEATQSIYRLLKSIQKSPEDLKKVICQELIQNLVGLVGNYISGSQSIVSSEYFICMIKSLTIISTSKTPINVHKSIETFLSREENLSRQNEVSAILDLTIALLPETNLDLTLGDGKQFFQLAAQDKKFPLNQTHVSEIGEVDVDQCITLLPVMISCNQSTVQFSVRVKTLIAMTRIINFLSPSQLENILKDISLAHFLSGLIGKCVPHNPTLMMMDIDSSHASLAKPRLLDRNQLTILTYAFNLSELLIKKLPLFYSIYLLREGVVHELENLQKCNAMGDDDLQWYREELVKKCVQFTQENFSGNSDNEAVKIMQKLKTLNKDNICDQFEWLFHVQNVTSFEMIQSGLVDVLFDIIDQISIENDLILHKMVQRLHECLLRTEQFELVTSNMPSSSMFSRNPAFSLLRRIRFRLQPTDDFKEKMSQNNQPQQPQFGVAALGQGDVDLLSSFDINNLLISIPSIASVKTLESFLFPHLHPFLPVDGQQTSSAPQARRRSNRLRKDSGIVHEINEEEEDSTSSMSYSNATTLIEQQYQLDLYLGDLHLKQGMTAFGSVHRFEAEYRARISAGHDQSSDLDSIVSSIFSQSPTNTNNRLGNVFSNIYTIKYRPVERSTNQDVNVSNFYTHLNKTMIPFEDLEENSLLLTGREELYPKVLQLLQRLYLKHSLDSEIFLNKKISAKIERQLGEILIISSGLTPSWARDICHSFGFLVSFQLRLSFLHLTGLSLNRSLFKWQQYNNNNSSIENNEDFTALSRISRQKVRVRREELFESLPKLMDTFCVGNKLMLEVEFQDEVGTGLGPTLEFYSEISKLWHQKKLGIWLGECDGEYFRGYLFPCFNSETNKVGFFYTLGQFIAKALFDFRLIDIPLHNFFLEQILYSDKCKLPSSVNEALSYMDKVDQRLAQSLRQLSGDTVNDLTLEFSVPGYPDEKHPSYSLVTRNNLEEYILFVVDKFCFSGIQKQISEFRRGFNSIFPLSGLRALTVTEISSIIGSGGQWEGKWDRLLLADSIKLDHGFTLDSRPVQWLLDLMASFNQQEQRMFLQFITGSPKLPIGGFKALQPPLTVVRRTTDDNCDLHLPSVMTCVNYLKLPEYSSAEVMREKMFFAINEGQSSFHLS